MGFCLARGQDWVKGGGVDALESGVVGLEPVAVSLRRDCRLIQAVPLLSGSTALAPTCPL